MYLLYEVCTVVLRTLCTVPLCTAQLLPSLKKTQPCFIQFALPDFIAKHLIRTTDSAKQEHELQENNKRKTQYKTTTPTPNCCPSG